MLAWWQMKYWFIVSNADFHSLICHDKLKRHTGRFKVAMVPGALLATGSNYG